MAEFIDKPAEVPSARKEAPIPNVLPKTAQEFPARPTDAKSVPTVEIFDSKFLTTPKQHEELTGKLASIDKLADSTKLEPGKTVKDLAEASLKERAGFTREKVDDKSVESEVKRIVALNGKTADEIKSGDDVSVYSAKDKADFRKMASDRMTPLIGGELVEMGVVKNDAKGTVKFKLDEASKKEIDEKKTNPSYRFGDALVELGFATRPEVEEAFGRQKSKRAEFNGVLEEYNSKKK